MNCWRCTSNAPNDSKCLFMSVNRIFEITIFLIDLYIPSGILAKKLKRWS